MYEQLIGKSVQKLSGKPFKSGRKVNIVSGIVRQEFTGQPGYTFENDDSVVECWRCEEAKKPWHNE